MHTDNFLTTLKSPDFQLKNAGGFRYLRKRLSRAADFVTEKLSDIVIGLDFELLIRIGSEWQS